MLEFFVLNILKDTFSMENLTQRWTKLEHFFWFSKQS